jgi:predicted RNA-binding protein with PUA domain
MLKTLKFEFEFWAKNNKTNLVKTFKDVSGSRIVSYEKIVAKHPSWTVVYDSTKGNPFNS